MPEDSMAEDILDRMPNSMAEDMSDRMPEDLPVRKCMNAMVGIIRSEVIYSSFFHKFKWVNTLMKPAHVHGQYHSFAKGISPWFVVYCFTQWKFYSDLPWVMPAFFELLAFDAGANDHTVYHLCWLHPTAQHDAQKIQRLTR
jgi:hypothetical protein